MNGLRQGSFRLFRLAGINVYLHWSWFLIALIEINARQRAYSSPVWNVLEYLALFAIVTTHEFGHALACRQVGGNANQIILWPLGGVAYVDPPARPGATLWSIAAGPLVNVALLPILTALTSFSRAQGWDQTMRDFDVFLQAVWWTNAVLLAFNMLPIYPLDGGQILRSLLWFGMGRARSLLVAVIVGFIGMAGMLALAVWAHSLWFGILAAFILLNCWTGLRQAQALLRIAKLPRREGFSCPACKASPPIGEYWICGQCRKPFDTFQAQARCPYCGTRFGAARCLDCGHLNPIDAWAAPVFAHPIV
jgi:Zn-dependent protease